VGITPRVVFLTTSDDVSSGSVPVAQRGEWLVNATLLRHYLLQFQQAADLSINRLVYYCIRKLYDHILFAKTWWIPAKLACMRRTWTFICIRSVLLLTMTIRWEHQTLPHSNAACHQLIILSGREKFTYAYKCWRPPHSSALHWNPPGFLQNKNVEYFSNRVVYSTFPTMFTHSSPIWSLEYNKCLRV
jgi:hypothetical protein